MLEEYIKYQIPCYTRIHNTVKGLEGPKYPYSLDSAEECKCIDVLAKDVFLFIDQSMRDAQLSALRGRLVNIQPPISFEIRVALPNKKITIIYHHELEQRLTAWISQEKGKAEEAASRIRKAYYFKQKELLLNDLELSTLPSVITKLSHLSILVLANNDLTHFPSDPKYGCFSELRGLYLDNNCLTTFSSAIIGDQLISLNLENNNLEEVSLRNHPELDFLSLSHNSLKDLPWEELAALTDLTHLEVKDNCLKEVSAQLWGLKKLRTLILSNNHLSTLPPGINKLESLRLLNISSNEKLQQSASEISRIELELYDRDRENECPPTVIIH